MGLMGTSVYKATQLNIIDYKDIHIIYLIVLLLHKAKKETSQAIIIFTLYRQHSSIYPVFKNMSLQDTEYEPVSSTLL